MVPDKFVELEALQSQFFSWIIILLRKFYILDKRRNSIYVESIIYQGMIFYLSAYLNKDQYFIKTLINELKLTSHFKIIVNQFEYFLSRTFPKDLSMYDRTIYNRKIIQTGNF